jgi:hypothetical protein
MRDKLCNPSNDDVFKVLGNLLELADASPAPPIARMRRLAIAIQEISSL